MEAQLQLVSRLLLVFAGLACAAMLALINLDVFFKYSINQPISGTLEAVAYYFMPFIVFCSFAHVQQHRHNIEISLLTDLLPRRLAVILECLARVLSLAYLAVFVWAASLSAMHATSVGETTGIVHYELPIWPSRWCVPVGLAATFLWMFYQLRKELSLFSGASK